MLEAAGIAIATMSCLLIIIDIVGNCLVCMIVKKNRDMRYVQTEITEIFFHGFEDHVTETANGERV